MKAMTMMAIVAALGAAQTAGAMTLTSSDVRDGATMVPEQVYTECSGGNVSPALSWSGAPTGTASFALTLYDPNGGPHGWWHWLVANIPATTASLGKGASPSGALLLKNDYDHARYDGPCPPKGSGLHHYQFTLYAMPAGVTFDPDGTPAANGAAIAKAALAKATLTGLYER